MPINARLIALSATLTVPLYLPFASAAEAPQRLLKHQEAFGDYKTDAPGVRRLITVEDMPRPDTKASADRGARIVPRPPGALPKAPAGFAVELLYTNLQNPRKIIAAPNGDIFVAESTPGRVTILREGPDGRVSSTSVFADKLRQPFGIAFYPPGSKPKFVYVANTDSVVRFASENGDLKARGPEEKVAEIPGGGKLRGGGHWTRDVLFTPDGKKMLVSVGSHSNNDDDDKDKNRADILEFNPDGTGLRIYASGIRNAVGIAIEPKTGKVWGSVNERDGLGDDVPSDYITHIEENGFYGWPWFYIGDPLRSRTRRQASGTGSQSDYSRRPAAGAFRVLCACCFTPANNFRRSIAGGCSRPNTAPGTARTEPATKSSVCR